MKKIKDFEIFAITEDGIVIRLKDRKIMKTHIKDGYEYLQLNYNGIRKYKSIHRLVAEAYLKNPNNKRVVNHKDFNRSNNCISNLEWCSDRENQIWTYNNNRRPNQKNIAIKNGSIRRKFNNKQIKEIKKRILNGEKLKNLAKEYKVHRETISRIKRGITYNNH